MSARKGCEQENLGEADFMETKFASLSRRSSATVQGKVGHAPRLPKGINITSWAPNRGFIHHSPPQD
jgi:hypothetical protein